MSTDVQTIRPDDSDAGRGRLPAIRTQLLIGGRWREPATTPGRSSVLTVSDPATGESLAEVADATVVEAAEAIEAASGAFETWPRTAPRYRADLLRAAFDLLMERTHEFATVITSEMGKPLAESLAEVRYSGEFLRWFAEEAVRTSGTTRTAPDGAALHMTIRQPVGPALLITPWNFPLAMATRKIAPALAAGCTVVLKPAEETPLTALLFAELLETVGVPPGVVNVLTTSQPAPVVFRILDDRRIRKLSFTGSTEVGRILLAASATGVRRASMELGGNAPFIVFDDADIESAVEGAVIAKLRNGGQSCVAANRFIIDRRVADEFVTRFADRLRAQVVGSGFDPATTLGPMVSRKQRDRAADLIRSTVDRGATTVVASEVVDGSAFLGPVLLDNVDLDAPIAQQEIFGPVAPIYRVDSQEEALDVASNTDAGLVGFAYSRDAARLMRVATALECGMVGLNRGLVSDASAPFGGIKQSGLGREGSEVGLHEYLETKYISHPFPVV